MPWTDPVHELRLRPPKDQDLDLQRDQAALTNRFSGHVSGIVFFETMLMQLFRHNYTRVSALPRPA